MGPSKSIRGLEFEQGVSAAHWVFVMLLYVTQCASVNSREAALDLLL